MRGRGILSLGLAVILFVFGMPRAFAQLDELKNTTPGERASLQTELMKSKLALTAGADASGGRPQPEVRQSNGTYNQRLVELLP